MCNSTAVRSRLPLDLGQWSVADRAYPAADRVDLDRRGVQMLEWSFPTHCGWEKGAGPSGSVEERQTILALMASDLDYM